MNNTPAKESPLSSKVAMFNNQAQQHKQGQLLNPFSASHDRSVSPKPNIPRDQYGKPLAGSLTEMRGQKANMHVLREMLELCQIISSEGYDVKDEPGMRVIPFGELFNIYNYISDKVVGLLLRARKHKFVEFEGEMLFQRRDDNVPIFLLKPIKELRHDIEAKIEDIKRATSPAPPQSTSVLLDRSAHQQKLQDAGLTVPGGSKAKASIKSRTPSPAAGAAGRTSVTASPAASKAASPAVSQAASPAASKAASPAPADIVTPLPAKTEAAAVDAAPEPLEPELEPSAGTDSVPPAPLEQPEEVPTAADSEARSADSQTASVELAAAAAAAAAADCVEQAIEGCSGVQEVLDSDVADDELPTVLVEATAVYVRRTSSTTGAAAQTATLSATESGAVAEAAADEKIKELAVLASDAPVAVDAAAPV